MNNTIDRIVKGLGNFLIGCFWGLLGVVIFLFSQIAAYLVCYILGMDADIYEGVYGFFAAVLGIFMIMTLVFLRGGFSFKSNKLVFKDKLKLDVVFPVVVISFGLMGIVILYFFAADQIAAFFPKITEEVETYSEAVDRYSDVDASMIPAIDSWLNLLTVSLLVPIVEEFTFRGVLFGEIERKTHPVIAIIISAVIFALLHGFSVQIGYALISGLIIGFVYYVTHSIWATILLHALFNFFGSALVTFLESGLLGDQSFIIEKIDSIVGYLDVLFIIPSIVCLVFLWKRYKDLKVDSVQDSVVIVEENLE